MVPFAAKDHDGKESEYESRPVIEILKLAGVKFGEGLDAKEGPLRIVTPDEKMHARRVRQVTGLAVKRAQ